MPTSSGAPHMPYKLLDKNGFEENLKKVIRYVKKGTTPKNACIIAFGIHERMWYTWVEQAEEDLLDGYTAQTSNLIKLMMELARADANVRLLLEQKGMELALDSDNVELVKFFLERRFGYSKTAKKEVELSSKEEAPVKFEFVNMTPTENED